MGRRCHGFLIGALILRPAAIAATCMYRGTNEVTQQRAQQAIGPLLYFRRHDGGRLHLAALMLHLSDVGEPAALTVAGNRVAPQ